MWGNGVGGWGMALMTASTLLFWGVLITGVVVLVRYANRGTSPAMPTGRQSTPQHLLAERFARGEIDEEEYTRRLQVLDAAATNRQVGG